MPPEGVPPRAGVKSFLELTVEDCQLRWRLERQEPGGSDIPATGSEKIDLSDRRKANVAMLSDLLRHAEDGNRRDALSTDLYRDLLRVVGHELFDLLFCDPTLRRLAADQLEQLRDGKIALFRITLSFKGTSSEFLTRLPWEYACTPLGDDTFGAVGGVFLARKAELVLSRRLDISRTRRLEYATWPIRVLLVASSPERDPRKGIPLLPVDAGAIVSKLEDLQANGYIKLTKLIEEPAPDYPVEGYEWKVTREAVTAKVIATDPVIIHFLGHGRNFGGAGHLAFARPNGDADWITDEEFARLIDRSHSFTLAFLQACESALPDPYVSFSGVARKLAREGLPAVVAMQYRVKASTANTFAAAFYDALLKEGLKIDHAVERGRESIAGLSDPHERLGVGLPVVYLNTDRGLTDPEASPPNPRRAQPLDRNDVDEILPCPRCGNATRLAHNVCRHCGLRLRCSGCSQRLEDPLGDLFCSGCGLEMSQAAVEADAVKRPAGAPDATTPARATLGALRRADTG